MDVKKTAAQILKEVGGKENIKEMFHCVTRLRFYLKDYKKVDLEHIKKIVEQYHGVIDFDTQNGEFVVRLILY